MKRQKLTFSLVTHETREGRTIVENDFNVLVQANDNDAAQAAFAEWLASQASAYGPSAD